MGERLLLDTHTFLWTVSSSGRLSSAAKAAILNKDNEIFLSKISYWEICLKCSLGKLEFAGDWRGKLEEERRINRFKWLEVDTAHCEGLLSLPWHHKDPFDRLLISQAQSESLSFISCDEKIAPYDVEVIW